jgi:uncharacterized membrane protein
MPYELTVLRRPAAGPAVKEALPASRFLALPWPQLSVALLLLALSGASVALTIATLGESDMGAFFASNALDAERRTHVWITFLVGSGTALCLTLFALFFSEGRAAPAIIRTADRYSPLILAAFVPTLFDFRTWTGKPLVYLIELAVAGLVTEHLVTRSLATVPALFRLGADMRLAARARSFVPVAIVTVAALAYAFYFSYFTLVNHRLFGTSGFDLGINVNWCYNALHGNPFRSTVLHGPAGGNFFAGHAIFAMILWLPVFAIHPGSEVLLIYQSVMCGLAAIPLYLFAKELIPRGAAVVVALAYLLFAPLHGPNFYDYHELPVALPFHFLLYLCIIKRRYGWAAFFAFILVAHREDIPVGLTILGVFLVVTGTRPRFGLALSACAVTAFVAIKFVVMPLAGPWWFSSMYNDLQPAGTTGYGPVIQTILINPVYFLSTLVKEEKLTYFLHLFAPLLFLSLRRLPLALLAIPGFFFTLMTTNYPPTLSIAFQYTTHWLPYLFLSTVIMLKVLRDSAGPARQWGAIIALGLAVLSHSTMYGAVIQRETFIGGFSKITFTETDETRKLYRRFVELVSKIPQAASVAATDREVAHVSARLDAYTLGHAHGEADYLVIRRNGMNRGIVQDAFKRNDYGLVGRVDKTFFLFKKGYKSDDTAKAKRDLGIK